MSVRLTHCGWAGVAVGLGALLAAACSSDVVTDAAETPDADGVVAPVPDTATWDGSAPEPVPDAQPDDGVIVPGDTTQPAIDVPDGDDDASGPGSAPWGDCTNPGAPGCPCIEANDCFSGFCVRTGSGKLCTETCEASCPEGWVCSDVTTDGSDINYICVPLFTNLCRPCTSGADCLQLGGTGGYCIPFADGQGSFCGGQCQGDADCPSDYGCQSVDLGQGLEVPQCVPLTNTCPCNELAIKDGASTGCQVHNEHGACDGARFCGPGGLSECDGQVPAAEMCNGEDDDCDGETDNLEPQACEVTNALGTCHGLQVCEGAEWLACDADTPAAEICDDLDNNCDGKIDEGTLGTFFVDADGDGFGDPSLPVESCELGGNLVDNNQDCNDGDPEVHPNQTESCDGVDNDCNGAVDDGVLSTFFVDQDQDGFGNALLGVEGCDPGADTVTNASDCNDLDPAVHPDQTEACDGIDNNCDGVIDDGLTTTYYADTDQDGFGNAGLPVEACYPEAGYVDDATDCNDQDPTINPGMAETCDYKDNDCNGQVDEDLATTYYIDADQDGYGNPALTIVACAAGPGMVTDATDCNDQDATTNPGVTEVCDHKDNNCNGQVDEGAASTFYADADQDGYGNPALPILACTAGTGVVTDATDCNDQDPAVNPGVTEACDYKDNDCNGQVDEGMTTTFYIDADKDGYGNDQLPLDTCYPMPGLVAEAGDCNDTDPAMNPGATEVCDYKDNNCDDAIDEAVAITSYQDVDGDGFGNSDSAVTGCSQPAGYVGTGGDCNDAEPGVFPGAAEQCNSIDDNCDDVVDGHTRTCTTDCGVGEETCVAGAFEGCTAPVVTKVTSTQVLASPPAEYQFACLEVTGSLQVEADITVVVDGFIRVSGTLSTGPRVTIQAGDDIRFKGSGTLSATDVTLEAGGTISVDPDATWSLESSLGRFYSGGGGQSCINGTGDPLRSAGAGGGARGGDGGMGAVCGTAVSTAPPGSGGEAADNGAGGVNCQAGNENPTGGAPSGGHGGAPFSGGGGGANGGAGGDGQSGYHPGSNTTFAGGTGASSEPGAPEVPSVGGGGAGAGGWGYCGYYCSNRCPGGGGYGAGIARVTAASFVNQGVVFARGGAGGAGDGGGDVPSSSGGGGGGAGGSFVFHVDTFDNTGLIVATGGAGGTGGPSVGKCGGGHGAGGGGGGGGRIYVGGPDGEPPSSVNQGIIQVNGGAGGKMNCTGAFAEDGEDGWVHTLTP